MGISSAAAMTTKLAMIFKPRIFSMLGMCCGFSKGVNPCKLNDVIVVEECACWDEGKYQEGYFDTEKGFKYRPKSVKASGKIFRMTSSLLKTEGASISNQISRLKTHKNLTTNANLSDFVRPVMEIKEGKMLSGLSVISDEEKIDLVLDRAPSAIGLEMEIFGVYSALKNLKILDTEFIALKGVADFGVKKISDLYDPVQPIASVSSFIVFQKLAEKFLNSSV